jgi:LysM repeat protein
MKDTLLADAFASCLDDIEKGISLDACLGRYPELRDELEPALLTVVDIRSLPLWQVSPEFKATARQRIVRRISTRRSEPTWRERLDALNPFAWVGRLVTAPVAVRAMAMVLALLLVISGGTAIASSETQPDNPLYQVKLAAENLELLLKPAGESRTSLLVEILDRRASELLTMSWQDKGDGAQRALVNYEAALQVGHGMLDPYDPASAQNAAFAVQWQEALARNMAVIQGLVDAMPPRMQAGLRTAIVNTQHEVSWVNQLLEKTPQRAEPGPTKVPEVSPTPGRCIYTVKKGDTLSGIAQRYNATSTRLAALNNLSSPDSISIGQQLVVPCTTMPNDGQLTPPAEFKLCPYTVKSGDTLSTIAQTNSTTTRLLIAVNNLPSADRILAGQRLVVPCYVK